MEYGSLQSVLDRFNKEMENQEDIETGLIKGVLNGADISLMRYSLGLAIKSAPGNAKEFFEHIRRRRGEPIRPDERTSARMILRLAIPCPPCRSVRRLLLALYPSRPRTEPTPATKRMRRC